MFLRWIVTNITSASVTTFLAFLAGIISWSVYYKWLVSHLLVLVGRRKVLYVLCFAALKKVKQSRYTPWRRWGGEEV